MKNSVVENIIAGSYALIIHIAVLVALFIGFEINAVPTAPAQQQVNIVQATVVDESQVQEQMQKLQKVRDKAKQAEEQRKAAKQAKLKAEKARKAEEKAKQKAEIERKAAEKQQKLVEEKRKQEEIAQQKVQQQRKAEEQRKAAEQAKLKAEKARKAEEKAKQKAEAERKAAEQAKLKAEKARKAKEKAKQKAEAERKAAEQKAKKAEADKQLQQALATEQQEREKRKIRDIIANYSIQIQQKINSVWIRQGNSQQGLQCTLRVTLLPGGGVKQVTTVKSSGNAIFDRSAESAVYKATPLPQPSDPKAAAALRSFEFIFKPE